MNQPLGFFLKKILFEKTTIFSKLQVEEQTMDKNLANLMIELLEEQASLIKKQVDRMKNYRGQEVVTAPHSSVTGAKKVKPIVDPNRPKRPPSGYQLFMSEQTPVYKESNPAMSQTELMSLVARKWTGLEVESKSTYIATADKLKNEYQEKVKLYDSVQDKKRSFGSDDEGAKKPAAILKSSEETKIITSVIVPSALPSAPISSDEATTEGEKKKKKKRKDEHQQEVLPSPAAVPVAEDKKKKVSKSISCGNVFNRFLGSEAQEGQVC